MISLLFSLILCASASTVSVGGAGNAVSLQGRAISSVAPADTNVLTWNASTSKWEAATGGAGGGADVHLGNLSAVAINASLLPATDQAIDVGSAAKSYSNGYIQNLVSTTMAPAAGTNIGINTANNASGNSGNIAISIGTASGTQGTFQLIKTGVANVIGDVLTATSTAGVGYWLTGDSSLFQNCTLAVTVGSHILTVALKTAAGSDPSASSPCLIAFRNATTATGTYAVVAAVAATSVAGSSGSQLGCPTAAVQCAIEVYAVNNAGTIVLGLYVGGSLDEGTVQTGTALAGSGADDASSTLWTTATQTSKAVRLIGRFTITPAAAFAWDNAVTETSLPPFRTRPWYINANLTGCNIALSTSTVASFTEMTNSACSLVPIAGSAPVGVVCSTTNAATAPTTGTTTCAAGNEGLGGSFNIPAPGVYEVCSTFTFDINSPGSTTTNVTFEQIETPTNAQTLTLESGQRILWNQTIGAVALTNDYGAYVCGIFNWTHKTAGTLVAVRAMYQSSITGTPTNLRLFCDEAVGRTCTFSAKRLN